MNEQKQRCPLCKAEFNMSTSGEGPSFHAYCPICGGYYGSLFLMTSLPTLTDEQKRLLSGYIANNSSLTTSVEITREMLDDIENFLMPYKEILMDERMDLIISYVAENTKQFGNPVQLEPHFRRFYFRNEAELAKFVQWMEKMGFVETHALPCNAILEPEGMRRYEALKNKPINSKQVFVAMDFTRIPKSVYTNAIEKACEDCGYKAFRVDMKPHNEYIMNKVIAEIKKSKFVIADFTYNNSGAYFEAGFARGLGREVISTCDEKEKDNLHFDIKQINHIFYKDEKDYREKLVDWINATIK